MSSGAQTVSTPPSNLSALPFLPRRVAPSTTVLVGIVSVVSVVILAILSAVLWLSFRIGDPGDADAYYSVANYSGVFTDTST